MSGRSTRRVWEPPPDYASAASWYQKAADQGYSRALINLGFLYEQGLGVPRDQATALRLYRKAAGIEGSINLEGQPAAASKGELDALRKELERTRRELEGARRLLDQERLKSGAVIERLTQQKLQAAAAGNAEETRRLESLLKEREAELDKRRQQVAQFERTSDEFRARLTGLEGESASLRQQLEQARQQLAQSQRDIEDKKKAAMEAERRLDAMQQDIARQKSAAAPVDPARIKALEAELEKSRTQFERQKQEVVRLEADVTSYKEAVAKLETRPQPAKQVVAMAAPSIQIIDPPIVVTRDTATVKVRMGLNKRTVVGRVTAPAGLLSFTANDVLQDVDADGYFKTAVELGEGKSRVTMVAVDRQGKRAMLEFFLQEDASIGKAAAAAPPKISGQSLGLGKYYALVIGNQKYQKLSQLDTPEADAKAVAELLKNRYGFTVTTLFNATRWEMLEELNKMRALVTDKDNLLIYYAGHGQLDRVNALANWLPVDADPASTANWIASSTLTENLNMMSAKHILVVADSCYSGAMTRSSIGQLQPGLSDEARRTWLKSIADSPSRTVLTSGGVSPGHGRRWGQAFGLRQELHRRPDGESGCAAGQATRRRALRTCARRRPKDEFPATARIRADTFRWRRVRRFHLPAEHLRVLVGTRDEFLPVRSCNVRTGARVSAC